mmetsp:Transcript_15922/g.39409  ORF Transcript_15922/g.39409 Transcript_15922/m.39409 type:complete len:205 (+) Transcript_15922:1412-2026(+)
MRRSRLQLAASTGTARSRPSLARGRARWSSTVAARLSRPNTSSAAMTRGFWTGTVQTSNRPLRPSPTTSKRVLTKGASTAGTSCVRTASYTWTFSTSSPRCCWKRLRPGSCTLSMTGSIAPPSVGWRCPRRSADLRTFSRAPRPRPVTPTCACTCSLHSTASCTSRGSLTFACGPPRTPAGTLVSASSTPSPPTSWRPPGRRAA